MSKEDIISELVATRDEVCRVRHIAEQLEAVNSVLKAILYKYLEKAKDLDNRTQALSRDINYLKRDIRIDLDHINTLSEPIEPLFLGEE